MPAAAQSVWLPLDDCGSDNGSLVVLPSFQEPPCSSSATAAESGREVSQAGESRQEEADEAGGALLLTVLAGSAVVFSSRLWHCSGRNSSALARRVLYAQYSEGAMLDGSASDTPLNFAVPCSATVQDAAPAASVARGGADTVGLAEYETGALESSRT